MTADSFHPAADIESDAAAPAGAVTGIPAPTTADSPTPAADRPHEVGGREGPEPTRYGDWELRGRCIDF